MPWQAPNVTTPTIYLAARSDSIIKPEGAKSNSNMICDGTAAINNTVSNEYMYQNWYPLAEVVCQDASLG